MIKSSLLNKRCMINLFACSEKNHASLWLHIRASAILPKKTHTLHFHWPTKKKKMSLKKRVCPWQLGPFFQKLILEKDCNKNLQLQNP